MTDRPDLSAIVVTWNTRDMTLDCLEALHGSIGALGAEIFVVDNGSSDGTVEAVSQRFPSVRLIVNPDNRGFAAANNQAIGASSGRYILLVNSDVIVEKGTPAALVEFMDATPQAGAAGAQLVSRTGKLEHSAAAFPSLATELLNKSLLRVLMPSRYAVGRDQAGSPSQVDSVLGACMIVRRETVESVGAFDEDFFFFLEETDWCRRMRDAGLEIYLVPSARAIHLKGRSKSPFRAEARVEYYRSLYKYFRKHSGPATRLFLRVGKLVKVALNFVMLAAANAFTIFCVDGLREKLRIYSLLFGWHLAFCPEGIGLPGKRANDRRHRS
ncbi:MAG: glycosyltransferase family 2 protein [Planctomycetota bacterium]